MQERISKLSPKEIGIDIVVDIAAGVLMAVGVQVFAVPAEFATSGLTGIALILHHLFQIQI